MRAMTKITRRVLISAVLIAINATAATPAVTVSPNATTIPRYDIYEVTMAHTGTYANPWEDVNITAVFTSPSAKTYTVGGFYYDTDTWKLRFAPMETGTWTWSLTFDNGSGQYTTNGSLTCSASSRSGFMRVHPQNVRRFITEGDGKPIYLNGYNIEYAHSNNPSPLTGFIDAFASPRPRFPILDIFNTYRRAGLNIHRNNQQSLDHISQYNVSSSGKNVYKILEGKKSDEVAAAVQQSGLKYMLSFWGFPLNSAAPQHGTYNFTGTGEREATLRYHKYMINRYGAYVDIWELGNELQNVTQTYVDAITGLCATNDPYQHITTVSFQQSQLNETALTAANGHPYVGASNLLLDDYYVHSRQVTDPLTIGISDLRALYPNKPIFLGECGNRPPYGNYDPERYRIGIWTAFINDAGMIYWLRIDTKYTSSTSGLANMYIGPEERAMARILANFTDTVDPLVAQLTPTTSPSNIRGYILGNAQDIVGYFLHTDSHSTLLTNGQVTLTIPTNGMQGQWIDPVAGNTLQTFTVNSGSQTLSIPGFKCDVALRIRAAAPVPKLEFSSASYTAQENQGLVTVTVSRVFSSTGAVSVAYATSDGLARAGTNYTAASGTLNWADGDMTAKSFIVFIQNNNVGESDKDFPITLSNPAGGALLGNNATALITLFDAGTTTNLTASFSATPTSGTVPLTVTFADTSTGTVTNRFWDFGDGVTTNTTASNVSHTYADIGSNTVRLIVSGPDGVSANTQANCITVTAPVAPSAAFTATPTSGAAPLAVTFTDTSTGTVTNRFWDFGDGATTSTTSPSISHTYAAIGTRTVQLIVSGPVGTSTNTQVNCIAVTTAPVAVDDNATINRNSQRNGIVVRANDSDADGDSLTITAVGTPAHGAAILNPQNSTVIRYTPETNYTGSDSFTYSISDGKGGAATATVHITIPSVNQLTILPLGDSITAGISDGQLPSYLGYRTKLLTNLQSAGVSFQYLGSAFGKIGDDAGAGAFEGHSGYTITQINSNLAGNDSSPDNDGGYWLTGGGGTGRNAISPDIVLLEIGTNDGTQDASAATMQARLQTLLGNLKLYLPGAHIFVASLVPRTDNATREATQVQYSAAIPGIVASAGANFHFVDMHTAFPAGGLGADKLHPAQSGYAFMADQWFSAITNLLAPTEPFAGFSATPTFGMAPLTVSFTDTSTGTITNRFWDFGDGFTTNTTATAVSHTYTIAGTSTVQLIVSGPVGVSTNTQVACIKSVSGTLISAHAADRQWDSAGTADDVGQTTGRIGSGAATSTNIAGVITVKNFEFNTVGTTLAARENWSTGNSGSDQSTGNGFTGLQIKQAVQGTETVLTATDLTLDDVKLYYRGGDIVLPAGAASWDKLEFRIRHTDMTNPVPLVSTGTSFNMVALTGSILPYLNVIPTASGTVSGIPYTVTKQTNEWQVVSYNLSGLGTNAIKSSATTGALMWRLDPIQNQAKNFEIDYIRITAMGGGQESTDRTTGMVIPFWIPDLGGSQVIGAEFALNVVSGGLSSATGLANADVYGVRSDSSSTTTSNDYSGGTLLANNWFNISSNLPLGEKTFNQSNLTAWIVGQVGTTGGKYIFITVRPDAIDGVSRYATVNTADAASGKPRLTLALLGATEPVSDADGDGIPDAWENQHFGSTNANPNAMAANGINTLYETYIAGLNPTNAQSAFVIAGGPLLRWDAVSGRVYSVYWTTNLMNGFQPLETNIVWPQNSWTGQVSGAPGEFYKIKVQLAP